MISIALDEFVSALKGDIPGYIYNKKEVHVSDRTLSGTTKDKDFTISNESFHEHIQIYRFNLNKYQNLIFENCTFSIIELKQISNCDNLKFLNCSFGEMTINGSFDKIEFRGGSLTTFNLQAGNVNRLVISGEKPFTTIPINKVQLDLRFVNKLYLIDSTIDDLLISRQIDKKGAHHVFSNLSVDKIRIHGTVDGTKLFFKNIRPKEKTSVFNILNSDLNNALFQDCNFKDFQYLKTENSHLENIRSENMHWFKKVVKWDDTEDIITYRQLKSAMMSQQDKVSEIYFRAKEMNAYLKWLKFSENKAEWILLQANKYSNQHGLSWIQGLKFTFCTTLVFFILYLISLKEYPFKFGWYDLSSFVDAISYFLGSFSKFFIITHDFEFLSNADPRGFSYFIDVISRIFIGYGIYQTVQAFRKYGRG